MAAAPGGMIYISLECVFVFEAFINDTYAFSLTIVQLKEYMAAAPCGKRCIPSDGTERYIPSDGTERYIPSDGWNQMQHSICICIHLYWCYIPCVFVLQHLYITSILYRVQYIYTLPFTR